MTIYWLFSFNSNQLQIWFNATSLHTCHGDWTNFLGKNLSDSYVRLEIIADKKGFWLKPHKDIQEKLMTMMIWVNPYNESKDLGTDFYNDKYEIVKTLEYKHNDGYFFQSK